MFFCMTGNSAETSSYSSPRSDGDMLRVWFSCSPFVPSKRDVKMAAPLEVCNKDEQRAVVRILSSEGVKVSETDRRLASQYGQNFLP
jgi:hypothetical protein